MNRVKIKVCGITSQEQAQVIASKEIDALGFILYPPSPRYLNPERLKKIVPMLPAFTKTIGVFVNEPLENVVNIAHETGIDMVQLSGDETPDYCDGLSLRGITWIKGFRIKNSESIKNVENYRASTILLDAWSEKEYGGTGNTFDWTLLSDLSSSLKVILAGGLNPGNIRQAILTTKPYAIDVSSGVEISPGVKSISKINALLAEVNQANQKLLQTQELG